MKLMFGALAAITAFVAAPALAAPDADCLWNAIPQKETKAAIAAGLADGADAMQGKIIFADVRAAAADCGYDASDANTGYLSEAAYGLFLQKLGEAWYEAHKVSAERLDRAWDNLGADTQTDLAANLASREPDNNLVNRVATRFTSDLGLAHPASQTEADQRDAFTAAYLGGRTLRAAFEPKL
jgi:hypothetical protein